MLLVLLVKLRTLDTCITLNHGCRQHAACKASYTARRIVSVGKHGGVPHYFLTADWPDQAALQHLSPSVQRGEGGKCATSEAREFVRLTNTVWACAPIRPLGHCVGV